MTWQAYDLGMLALERRDPTAAREHFQAAGALFELGQLASAADPAEAARLYEQAAGQGDPRAACNLGALHATGRLGEPDHPAALRWYQRSADLGDHEALRMTGLMYAIGQGTPPDNREAETRWRTAAAAGVERACHDLGTLYAYHHIDLPEAGHWLLRAAKAGFGPAQRELELLAPRLVAPARDDPKARTVLGVIRAFHLGDPAGGAALLAVSAEHGDPVAQRSLAFLLQEGAGVPADDARAADLYRAAAEGGDAFGAYNMALLAGPGPAAIPWLRIAAAGGVTGALTHLGNRLSDQDLDEEALQWYVRGAEAGEQGSMFAAACWYRDGFGGPVDLVQALRWYLTLLNLGSGDGVHEAHQIAPHMSADDIHEAGRLSGRYSEADLLAAGR